MTGERNNQECAEFQSRLSELIGAGDDVSQHPHILGCDRCRELLNELETIAEAARLMLPSLEPPDEVWEHIDSAIKAGKN